MWEKLSSVSDVNQEPLKMKRKGQRSMNLLCQNWTVNDWEVKVVSLTRWDSNIWRRLWRPPCPKANHHNCQLYRATKALKHLRQLAQPHTANRAGGKLPRRTWRTNCHVRCERAFKYCSRDLVMCETGGYTGRQSTSSQWVNLVSVAKASFEDSGGTKTMHKSHDGSSQLTEFSLLCLP